jgi:hypothetical protein
VSRVRAKLRLVRDLRSKSELNEGKKITPLLLYIFFAANVKK